MPVFVGGGCCTSLRHEFRLASGTSVKLVGLMAYDRTYRRKRGED